MNNIHERIREIRKSLNIKQGDFAKLLGLTNAAVSMIESGKNPLTESNLRLICMIFNVRESWLRTGEGDMLDFTDNDPFINEVIELMQKLSQEEREVVLNYVRWYASQQQALVGKHTAEPPTAGFPLEPRPALPASADFEEERSVG
jgi:transcriptional regulator with XRE-family HTH domain